MTDSPKLYINKTYTNIKILDNLLVQLYIL